MLNENLGSPRLRMAVRLALTGGSLAASFGVANAQTAPATAANANTDTSLQEVVVTGSRISVPNQVSISPVTFVSALDIQTTGVTRVEDLLNELPQVFASQGSNISNGADGTATVDLRGLGAKRTLVLVNGNRLGPGDPLSGAAADINMIPVELIDSVEVLTGGASSTYGADAVAGVVNFIMDDHFEGFRVDANASDYNHHQHNAYAATVVASGDPVPTGSVNDGQARDVTLAFGKNLADGAGNFTAYAGYRHIDPVLGSSRDFAACAPNLAPGTPTGFVCAGSSTSATGRFIPLNGSGDFTVNSAGAFIPWPGPSAEFNFAPSNFFQRPDERWTAGEFLHLDLTDKIQVYNEFMFMDDTSTSQIAPGGAFIGQGTAIDPVSGLPNGAVQTNCSNPFLSATELAALCGGSTAGNAQFLLGRRDVEGGTRNNELDHTSFRMVVGTKGEIVEGWKYDAYLMEGRTEYSNYGTGNFSKTNFVNSMDVITSPTTGLPICASGANGCVPYDVFKVGGVTQAALNYVDIPAILTGSTEERVGDANVTGDLGKYGVKVPGNADGLIINIGTQWRSEYAILHPDAPDQNFDVFGTGGPTLPLSDGFHVWEGYVEAGMPIIEDKPYTKELSFEVGYRYSSYNLGFDTNTYKFGLNWAPTSDVRVRGSYQRAVRAPNLQELFVTRSLALEGSYDDCAGSTTGFPTASLAQCKRTGVTAAQYGKILPSPAGQYQGFTGGNPLLRPEQADTTSFGFILTPSMVPNLTVTIDYFNIRIKDVISSYGFPLQLTDCLQTGTPTFCGDIHRDAAGTLWASPLGYINDPTLNLGALSTRGVDLTASYKWDLNRFGKLNFTFAGTYTGEFITEPGGVLGTQNYDCAGYYGSTCGVPSPKWRHKFRIDYDSPLAGLGLGLQWRHIGSVQQDTASPNPLLAGTVFPPWARFPNFDYFDLTASYTVNKTVSFRVGVNNILDKDPPTVSANYFVPPFSSENTYPQVYDSLGRFMFANVTLNF